MVNTILIFTSVYQAALLGYTATKNLLPQELETDFHLTIDHRYFYHF